MGTTILGPKLIDAIENSYSRYLTERNNYKEKENRVVS